MTRSIPWPRILAEGFAIVVSILLAFGIQAWWEERGDHREEREILSGLEEDLIFNLDEIQNTINNHLGYERSLVTLGSMTDEELDRASRDSALLYLRALVASNTFEARDATLDGVIASGSLELVRDRDIREQLLVWKRLLEELEEEVETLLAIDRRALRRIGALGGPWSADGEGLPQLSEVREAYLRLPSPDLRPVAHDAEMMAIAREKRFASVLYISQLVSLREAGKQVLASIQDHPR